MKFQAFDPKIEVGVLKPIPVKLLDKLSHVLAGQPYVVVGAVVPPTVISTNGLAEHVSISYASVKGMEAAHRQTSKSPVIGAWRDTVAVFHERNHNLPELPAEYG